ncbi:hypothetical protein AB0D46_16395 [Streptomyces sp. NPDC048383]|uniref:hypothetical protein n=1 Tax=Streptomyces sp. NPDC048383 TaxID=3155386 RepID=UPI00341CA7FB
METLKPPRALTAVTLDPSLRCKDANDIVAASVATALTAQVPSIHAHLADPLRRLPVLVVSSMRPTGPSAALARKAAVRLVGLAHVVVVSGWLAFDVFNSGNAGPLLPREGARLYWPGTGSLRSPWWDSAALSGDHEVVLRDLTRLLAPLSVAARGRDRIWGAVRAARTDTETEALLVELTKDAASAVDKVRALLEDEREDQLHLLEKNEALEKRVGDLEIDVANLEARLGAAIEPAATEPETMPVQASAAQARDFTDDWGRWQRESGGAMAFTERAVDGWAKCTYPMPERMREALDSLADLAGEWKRRRGKVGTSLVSWIGDQTALVYAPSDERLRRSGRHEFDFEGQTWDRQPHIKLDDHVTPDRVGRIYFAIDSGGLRWIVDHVGLKLYGL